MDAQNYGVVLEQKLARRRFNNQAEGAGELLDLVVDALREIKPPKEDLLRVVGNLYDRFVAPIDLPWVPNLIEPTVDAMLRRYLLATIDTAYDRLFAEAE